MARADWTKWWFIQLKRQVESPPESDTHLESEAELGVIPTAENSPDPSTIPRRITRAAQNEQELHRRRPELRLECSPHSADDCRAGSVASPLVVYDRVEVFSAGAVEREP
jgi:hypothetical protein